MAGNSANFSASVSPCSLLTAICTHGQATEEWGLPWI